MAGKQYYLFFLGLVLSVLAPNTVFAQDFNDIAQNIGASVTTMPALVAGMSYLAGVLVSVLAVLKTVDHVSNPTQTPLRVPMVRFLLGGALFGLPMIMEVVTNTISGGAAATFGYSAGGLAFVSNVLSLLTGYISFGNINSVLNSVLFSANELPALIAIIAYLLAIIITVSALYKTRDHVDDPDRTPLKDAVTRYLTAGALFALPAIFEAVYTMIQASGMGALGTFTTALIGVGMFYSTETSASLLPDCDPTAIWFGGTVGDVICSLEQSATGIPYFLTGISYMLGLVFGLWAVLKLRDHVLNPQQTALSEGIMRLVASGLFFALPVISMVFAWSVTPVALMAGSIIGLGAGTNTGFTEPIPLTCVGTNSLDQAMACFMDDVLGPVHVTLNFFCFCAGMIFIMIGISRLIKTSQEGARGPGGAGTISTFVIGGLLISATTILRAVSKSFFNNFQTATSANLTYAAGMSVNEQAAAYNVINAVLKFMIVIGMISFVRGLFIMRDVSEGSQQASTMAGLTHILGGALAVNLGPLLNAIQTTLGITAFGVTFS